MTGGRCPLCLICEIDLRVGGEFHNIFVTPDGKECSFRGTYLEIEPPTRLVNTGVASREKSRFVNGLLAAPGTS